MKINRLKEKPFYSYGFTLTELTIVLVIVGLLIAGMIVPLSAQRDAKNINETRRQLIEIKEALLGFAAANGRLPCPARPPTEPNASGVESPPLKPQEGGDCTNPWDGYLPATTLGISPVDGQGYAVDAWNNRIRYAVTKNSAYSFTTSVSMQLNWATLNPDLQVKCAADPASSPDSACKNNPILTSNAVAIIFSTGANGATPPPLTSADEQLNWKMKSSSNDTNVFVSAEPSPTFDDIVTWISPYILYNRMIAAGKLP